jgi:ATP-dependent helicase/DNAse subunit B
LEAYAQCPFRFLMEQVLGLVPLRDLTLETDVMRRGMLLHDALAEYHRRVVKEGVKTAAVDGPALLGILRQRVEARGGSAIDSALVEIEHRQLQGWAEKYPDQEALYRKHWADLAVSLSPQHLEIRFGPPRHGEPKSSEDPHSTDEPFVLDIGGEEVKFTGRIDRVDVGQAGERTVFSVIDYKSGKKLSLSEVEMEAGRQLQLPLYVMAAQVLFFEKTQGVPVSAGYWKVRGGGLREKDTLTPYELTEDGPQESEAWKRRQESLRSRVRELIDGIRRGEFPMDNVDEECTIRCSFSSVCRVSQVRSIGKARQSDVADSSAAVPISKPAKAVASS